MERGRVRTNGRRGGLTTKLGASALLLWAATASADARTEARTHFKKGMGLVASAHYEEAISELQRAYEILPHPSVLYNIGRACLELGDLDAAIANFRRYLETDPPDRDETAQLVVSLEARLKRAQAAIAAPAPATAGTPGSTVAPDSAKVTGTQPTVFPPGTAPTAEGAVEKIRALQSLFEADRARVSAARSGSIYQQAAARTNLDVFDHLRRRMAVSIPATAQELGTTKPTVARALNELVALGIAREATGRARDRVFVYDAFLEILDRD